jgi:NAD(P)-dependent dehydrogenase (short-subunit alcohol dehydrogenase family)
MPGRLHGKVCVVTGTASGIGAESARLFAEQGARVVGIDLDAGDGRCHWILGAIQIYRGDWRNAERHYQRAVALNPNDANAKRFLQMAKDKKKQ